MKSLLSNVRFYVLVFSVTWSVALFGYITATEPDLPVRIIVLTQYYALTALTYLYFTLLCGPFVFAFKTFPYKGVYFKARRALGVSTAYFALLHASLAFFLQLGGLAGVLALPGRYQLAIVLSSLSLLMLLILSSTSFNYMVKKLSFKRWKLLHRLVYVIGVFTLMHALLIGTHFQDLSRPLPRLVTVAVGFLLYLYAVRFDAYLKRTYPMQPSLVITRYIVAGLVVASLLYVWFGGPQPRII